MGFLNDMKELVGELTGVVRGLRAAPDQLNKAAGDLNGPDDFLQRPIDSVAKRAKSSILLFPVVGSESLSPETVATISRAVQVRATEYVRLYVTNLDPREGGGKGAIVSSLQGSSLKDAIFDESASEVGAYVRKNIVSLVESAMGGGLEIRPPLERHILSEALKDPRTSNIRNFKPNSSPSSSQHPVTMSRKDAENLWANNISANPGAGSKPRSPISPEAEMAEQEAKVKTHSTAKHDSEELTRLVAQLMQRGDARDLLNQMKKTDERVVGLIASMEKLPKDALEVYTNEARVSGWKPTEFDKVNRFPPVLLDLTVHHKSGDNVHETKMMIGVKAVAHVVPSVDLVTGLGTALQRDSLFLQFMRLTSGETSFVKDFVLNLGAAKARASSKTSGGTKMLETLRRQAEWNDLRRTWVVAAVSKRGFVPPTTTVIVTADEVERIRGLYGVDFSKPAVARDLLKSHNLMGFAIVDESIGLVRFYEDGDGDFDRIPMSEIKERGSQTSVKDMMTILART
jgi:hypothetical protein